MFSFTGPSPSPERKKKNCGKNLWHSEALSQQALSSSGEVSLVLVLVFLKGY